jgi:4-hydroxybenzoate polyprenyltransferase
MAQLFLFSPGESIVEGFSNSMFWAISFTTAFLIAGGSLLNSFYDLEKDITQRPFRTILERPVARKYGIRLAVWFYFFAMITAWLNLESLISILFSIYGILLWLYSHKSWNTNVLGPLIATLLAYTPLLILAYAGYPESSEGFMRSLPMAIAMILLEWRRQSERLKMYTVAQNKRKSAIQRQWIYKAILATGVICIAIV